MVMTERDLIWSDAYLYATSVLRFTDPAAINYANTYTHNALKDQQH